ncbi:MAG: hypothetical protein H7329_16150 [Opitutaceae bacterium]|nr:hypothetical protein [Cytophagales bacterium]
MENHPDLLISSQDGYTLRKYLEDKVRLVEPLITLLPGQHKSQYVIEEKLLAVDNFLPNISNLTVCFDGLFHDCFF